MPRGRKRKEKVEEKEEAPEEEMERGNLEGRSSEEDIDKEKEDIY